MGWGHPASNHALPWLFLCSSASGVISFSSAPWQNPQAMFAGLAFGGTASDISPGHTPSPRAQGQRMLLPAARRGCLQPDFALCQHQCSLWELNLQNRELLLATAKCLKGPFLFSIGFSCGSRLCILFAAQSWYQAQFLQLLLPQLALQGLRVATHTPFSSTTSSRKLRHA